MNDQNLQSKTSTDSTDVKCPSTEYNVQQAMRNMHPADQKVIQDAFNRLHEDRCRRTRILGLLQEALGQLRLDLKYLIFDLEATRRERDEAIERLDR